jgi:hypothetical protein
VETGCQGGQGSPRAVAPSEEEESCQYDMWQSVVFANMFRYADPNIHVYERWALD